MKYAQKLLDPRWQKKRLEILNRDNFTCTECGDTKNTLHVHHEAYKGNPWDIENDKLKTLCDKCHSKEHFGETVLLSPTPNTTAKFIYAADLEHSEINREIIKKYNRIEHVKKAITEKELISLRVELTDLCIQHKVIVVDCGITYGLQ